MYGRPLPCAVGLRVDSDGGNPVTPAAVAAFFSAGVVAGLASRLAGYLFEMFRPSEVAT